MRHTLQSLRLLTAELLDDPSFETFNVGRLSIYLNIAYQDVVNEFRLVATANLQGATADVTLAAGVREVILPERTGTLIVDPTELNPENGLESPVRRVEYSQRDIWAGFAVYLFRKDDARMWLGVTQTRGTDVIYRIRSMRAPTWLQRDEDVPTWIPEDHHELIGMRAAIIAKGGENRESRKLDLLYVEGLLRMKRVEGMGLVHSSNSRVWG